MYERRWYIICADSRGATDQKATGPLKTLNQALQQASGLLKRRMARSGLYMSSHQTTKLSSGLYELVPIVGAILNNDDTVKPAPLRCFVGRKEALAAYGLAAPIEHTNFSEGITRALGPNWNNGHESNH